MSRVKQARGFEAATRHLAQGNWVIDVHSVHAWRFSEVERRFELDDDP